MLKKIISYIMVVSVVTLQVLSTTAVEVKTQTVSENTVWTGSVANGFASGTGSELDPYIISNAEELAYLAASVNDGESYTGKYIKLSNDIYLNDVSDYDSWSDTTIPKNVWDGMDGFSGTIDGQGHTIWGMFMCSSSKMTGFINTSKDVSNSASTSTINATKVVIKNINFKMSYVQGTAYVGTIIGSANSFLEIDNCEVSGKVIGTGANIGGLVGCFGSGGNRRFLLTNSINYATVLGGSYTGGLVGFAHIGNSSGYSTSGNGSEKIIMNNCINDGKIEAGGNYVGGVVGRISRSMNCGGLELRKLGNENEICGVNYVGGIFGYLEGDYYAISLEESYNSGNISGTKLVGGLVGSAESGTSASRATMQNLYNIGSVSATSYVGGIFGQGSYVIIIHCYNMGDISGDSSVASLLGHAGYSNIYGDMGIVKYSYYLITSASVKTAGSAMEVVGYSQEQMKLEDNYNGFDFNKVWKMGTNSPIFLWQIGEEYVTDDTAVDDYMVEQVKKYTSDDIYTQYNRIMNSGNSVELKFKKLNDLFASNGLVDAKEGLEYLSNTTSHRNSYRYLTTNEIYCAFNFLEWLYSDSAILARGLLYADGLIFNGEVFDYADVSTYSENDYPGVKKNKEMLKQFMSYDAPEIEVFENANKTAKYFKNLLELNNIAETAEMDSLMNQILVCESEEGLKKLQTKFVNNYVIPQGMDKIYLNGEPFAEALGYASDFISFAGATADDILGILNLSNEIETYEKYRDFLTTIYECKDVSFEMRLAAYSLLDEIENGYMNKLKSILLNGISLENGIMEIDETIFKELVGEGGEIFLEAIGTLKLATFISNIVVDTGDFVKQAAYTQGYAELATLYSLKLKEDKIKFQSAQTPANAWKFFEDYTMLWALRYQGEQQYLEMNTIKMYLFAKVKSFNYDMKEEVVKDTLSQLNTRKFEVSDKYTVPESIMYNKKAVINCPVDVEIYTKDGNLVAVLQDGIESDITNEYGRFAVVYQPYSGEYAKVICQSTDVELVIKATAISDGLVDWQMSTNKDGECVVYAFDKVQVSKGDVIETTSSISEESTYSICKDGDQKSIYKFVLQESDDYVAVKSLMVKSNSITMNIGDSEVVGISVLPTNATNKDVRWRSSDEDVVSIKNGVINAKGVGEAIVYVNAIESDDIQKEISVTVQKLPDEIVSTPTPSSTVAPTLIPTATPTVKPTVAPTSTSTATPTVKPTVAPTSTSTATPTVKPTVAPPSTFTAIPTATSAVAPSNPSTENSAQDSAQNDSEKMTKDLSIKVGDILTQKTIKYKVTEVNANGSGEVSLIRITKKKTDRKFKSLKIEDSIKINGKSFKITSIGSRAFSGYKYLKKITIGKNVAKIGKKAFYKCKKVKNLVVQSTKLKSVGNKAISEINKKAHIKVPKKRLSLYKKLFKTKIGYKRTMKIKK